MSGSKHWLSLSAQEGNKYARNILRDRPAEVSGIEYIPDQMAPLRPWAQLCKAFELRVRANAYTSGMQRGLRTAFFGEDEQGELASLFGGPDGDEPLLRPERGHLAFWWDLLDERAEMERGRTVPTSRNREEVTKVNLVRDMVLERLMSSQKTKGFSQYDKYNFGITRGYLREAAAQPDLAEGICWLSLVRTRAFPTVEGAWQRIKRSGQTPAFERGKCPLCRNDLATGWEWTHLLQLCRYAPVVGARDRYLEQSRSYVGNNLIEGCLGDPSVVAYANEQGLEDGSEAVMAFHRVVSIILCGGLYCSVEFADGEGWFNTYTVGFGHTRLIMPGFETFGYVYVASFFQSVAPLFVQRLGVNLYGDWSEDGSHSGSSLDNDEYLWHSWFQTSDVDSAPPTDSDARMVTDESDVPAMP